VHLASGASGLIGLAAGQSDASAGGFFACFVYLAGGAGPLLVCHDPVKMAGRLGAAPSGPSFGDSVTQAGARPVKKVMRLPGTGFPSPASQMPYTGLFATANPAVLLRLLKHPIPTPVRLLPMTAPNRSGANHLDQLQRTSRNRMGTRSPMMPFSPTISCCEAARRRSSK
jgi:hypothetical protein